MVKLWFIVVSIVLTSCSAHNADHGERTVKSKFTDVKIEYNGAYQGNISSDETEKSCEDFVLSETEVTTFFSASRSATDREYAHDLIASNCYANGSFVLEGTQGIWQIDRARRGFLSLAGKTEYYYCAECDGPLFYETCDINCVHGEEN